MRVHQPGGHLMRGGRAEVDDWSWARTKRRLRALYRLARPYKARTLLALVSLLAATAVALAPPYLVGRAVDEVKRGDTHLLGWLVVAFVAVGALGIAFGYAQTYFTGWTGERMLADLRNQLFRHLQRLSLGFYERNRAGVIISRLTNDVEALDQLVTDGVTSLVQNTLTLVGTAIVLFFLDWRLALASLTVMPLMALATAWFRKRSGRAYRRVR
jgi:ATP-binding cassette subfamily B protein